MHSVTHRKRPRVDDDRHISESRDLAGQEDLRLYSQATPALATGNDSYVRLNVGGKKIDVPGEYLRHPSAGMLRRLTDGSMSVERDADGRMRVDADPKTFRHIVWYWRHKKVPDYLAPPERDMLAVDAEYLGLFDLSTGLKLKKIRLEAHLSVVHHFKYADALFDAGDERQAIKAAAKAHAKAEPADGRLVAMHYLSELQKHPTCPWRRVHAPCSIATYDFDSATEPTSPVEACLRACASLQYKGADEAKHLAESVLESHPDFTEARAVLAQAFVACGDMRSANVELSRLRGVSPHQALALAACKAEDGEYRVALLAFDTALQYNCGFVTAYIERALTHNKFGKHQRATADFARAADVAPDLASQYGASGRRHQADGRYDEAERCFAIASQMQPNNVEWHAALGKVYLQTDWKELAIQCFERAVQLQPSEAHHHYLLSSALDYADQDQRAIEAIGPAIQLAPDNTSYHQHLGDLYYQNADYAEAVAVFGRVCDLDSHNLHSHVRLAQCLMELGRHTEAAPICRCALAIGPAAKDLVEDIKKIVRYLAAVGDCAGAPQTEAE